MKKESRYFLLFLSLLTLFAVCLACWHLSYPGLYYDEMLFGNAAVGGKSDNFVRLRVLGVSVLLMDYIGALKSWIYYPIFSILSVNYWTVRLPSILIGVAGGLGLVATLWRGFGRNAAVVGAVMILLDPTMLTHSRVDWGPNALMFFFRGWLLFAMVSWIKTANPKWAWMALIMGMLGVFDKLSFTWVLGAAIGSLVLVYSDAVRIFVRTRTRPAFIITVLVTGGFTMIVMRSLFISEHQDISWHQRFSYAMQLLRYTLSGGGALNFISGNGLRLEKWFWPGYLAAAVIALFGIRALFENPPDKRLYIWILVFMGLLTTAFVLTKSATGSHHSSVVSGIWQLALAPLIGAFLNHQDIRFSWVRIALVSTALIFVFAGSVRATMICEKAFLEPVNHNWDRSNAEAALFAKDHKDAYFISTDWGIGTQVIALTKDHPGISDAWPAFTKQEDAENYLKSVPRDKDIYIYTLLPDFENFKGNRANLLAVLEKDHIVYQVVKTYSNWQGVPMIEIWHIHL